MQDGLNTIFEEQLNNSDWGKYLQGTSTLNPQGPSPKTSTQVNYDQLQQSLIAQGEAVNKSARQSESPYKEELVNPLQLDLTGRYKRQVFGADNEDLWGQSQSNWDKMFNGISKGLIIAGTTFLQGTLGLVYGVGQVVSGHGFSSLYSNDLSNFLQGINDKAEDVLPNYATARERAADWWEPDNLFTANFLWDKLVKNLGFSVGAIYSGAVMTKMLGLIPKIFGASKGGMLGKMANSMEKELSSVPPLQRPGVAENIVMSASGKVNTINKVISPVERFVISTLGAATEGGIEALQGLNQWRDQKIEEYTNLYGKAPIGDELEKINDMAKSLGNARFGMNMALLTATNYIQLPRILSSSFKDSKIISNGVETSINRIARNLGTGVYETVKRGTARKLLSKTSNALGLLFSPTESFEELSQYAAEKAVDDYYNKAYKGEGRDWIESIAEGYRRARTDKEGLESAFIGGISGGIQQAGFISKKGFGKTGALGERGVFGTGGEKKKQTESFLSELNKSSKTLKADEWLQAMAKSAARGINLQLEGQEYVRQGDILEVKDNEFDYQHNYLTPRIKFGRMDLIKSDLEDYRQMAGSPEGWSKLKEMGIANALDTRESFNARLGSLERHAENVNSLYQSLNVRHGGVLNKDGKPKYSGESIEKMVYAASKIANYDERIPQVNAQLGLKKIAVYPLIDKIVTTGKVEEEATKQALEEINALPDTSDVKDQLKSDLRDVIEMSLRRRKFLKEYDQLKANPESFTPEPDAEISTTATVGGKEREVGKTYSLAQPMIREGNKLSVSPTLEILSSTLGGELEVRTPTGEISYKKPKDISYELMDTDTTSEEYNAIAEKAVDTVIAPDESLTNLQEKLDFVNQQDDKELTDAVEEAITTATQEFVEKRKKSQAENENLAKDEALKKKLEEEQRRLNGVTETKDNPTEAELKAVKRSPAAPLGAFLSKEAEFLDEKNPKPHQKRRLKFLSLLSTFPESESDKIRVLAITRSNEATYGLTGLIDWVVGDFKNTTMTDEQRAEYASDTNPIVKLYTIQEGNTLHIVDPEGNKVAALTGTTTTSPAIFDESTRGAQFQTPESIAKMESILPQEFTGANGVRLKLIKATSFSGNWRITYRYADENGNFPESSSDIHIPLDHSAQVAGKNAAKIVYELAKGFTVRDSENTSKVFSNMTDARIDAGQIKEEERENNVFQEVVDSGVFGVFHSSIEGVYKFGPKAGQKNWNGNYTDEEFKAIQAQFNDWRAKMQVSKKSTAYSIKYISRGMILRDEENKAVTDTDLVSEQDIITKIGLITIPTVKGYTIGDISYNFDVGIPILTNGPNVDFLNNRTFSEKEAEDIFQLIRARVERKGTPESARIEAYLSSILYLRSPKTDEEDVSDSQIFHQSNGLVRQYFFGNQFAVDFNIHALDLNKKQIVDYLKGYYVKTNNQILTKPSALGFEEAIPKPDGTVEFVQHKHGYQWFMLSKNAHSVPFLQTRAKRTTSTGDPTIIHRYTTLKDSEFAFAAKPRPAATKEEAQPAASKAPKTGQPKGGTPGMFGGRKKKGDAAVAPAATTAATPGGTEDILQRQDIERKRQESLSSIVKTEDTARDLIIGKTFITDIHGVKTPISDIADVVSGKDEFWRLKEQINAIYDAQLALLSSPAESKEPETQKDSIEKRRQEELFSKIDELAKKPNEYGADLVISLGSLTMFDKSGNIRKKEELLTGSDIEFYIEKEISKSEKEVVSPEHKRNVAKFGQGSWLPSRIERLKEILNLAKTINAEYNKKLDTLEPKAEPGKEGSSPFAFGIKSKKEKFKDKDPSIGKGDFSIRDETESYTPINIEKELAAIREKSPFNAEILENMISLPQGVYAWGQFKGMLISLYKNAKAGTGYHELFEGVWKVFTTPQQKADIIREFRQRKGNFTSFDGKEYTSIPYSQASQWQIKEKLANEFAEYMLSEEEPQGNKISRWFKQLWELIKSIFNGRISTIDSLFQRINAGAYKSASPLYVDEETEYSFVDMPYSDQYSTVRGMALEVVRQTIDPNHKDSISLTEWEESGEPSEAIYDRVYARLKEVFEEDIYTKKLAYSDAQITAYEGYWKTLQENWTQVKDATKEYLKSFGIIEGIENEDGEISRYDKEDYSNRDYMDENKYWMNDARNTTSRSIKLLIATLPESIFQGAILISDRDGTTLMERQVNYAKTFNSLLAQMIPLNTYDEKMKKLEELSRGDANFKRLYMRLMEPSNRANPDSVLNDWKLKVRFYQAMAKQAPTPWIQYNQSNGKSYTKTANQESSKKLLVQSWIDYMKTIASTGTSETFNINDRGELVVHTVNMNFSYANPQERTDFLAQLGIKFTTEMYDVLSKIRKGKEKSEAEQFSDAVSGLAAGLKGAKFFILDNSRAFNSVKNLETIAQSAIRAGSDFETTFFNLEKERQTTAISTNPLSRWINDINNSENRDQLLARMPHLADVKDSVYLNSVLFNETTGERTPSKLDLGYIQGTLDARQKPIPGAKLPIFQRLVQEINQNINQRYYVLMPADGKTQWLADMKNLISYQNVATNSQNYEARVKALFTRYYETEKAEYQVLVATLSEKELADRNGVFRVISENYTMSSEDFYKTIGEFFNLQIAEQRRELEKYQVIVPSRTVRGLFEWKGLDGDFVDANKLDHKALQSQTIEDILRFRTLNFAINNVEMHKIFYGSALAYPVSKYGKQWKLFMSPREISMYNSKEYNNFLNQHFNKNTPNALTGKWTFSDYITTAMMTDLKVVNEALSKFSEKYKDINPTDAQAWSHLVAMRERRLKAGSWKDKDEKQFQYSQAQDRRLMLLDGILQSSNSKADNFYPPSLSEKDIGVLKKGNPNSSYIYVEKPILSGHVQADGQWTPIADKYSIVSFSYAAVRDTNFRDHYVKMLKQGLGYIIASSGRKIGKTQANSFYTADGSVNTEPYVGITPVPFSAFGTQTDTSNKKESQTRGSQVTKLIIINLHDNGKPITEEAGRLSQDNINLLKEQTKIGYEKLLRIIGAEDKDGRFRVTDKRKIVKLLKGELLRREVADSIKALIDVKSDNPNDLVMPFEALPNYVQVKNILYSFVDKYILRPKVSGAPKVQVSGALMEKYGVRKGVVNGKDVYYSSSLHFYTEDEPWIDVLLPAWAADKLRKAGLKWETTEELYDLFKNSPDAKQLLAGVGFRIPTQELNSVENFRIAGFLPEEFGDTIVVPEEITTKAGSDFDIDKLNTYLQNIYVDNKKQLRVVPYFGIGEKARKQLKDWLSDDVFEGFILNESKLRPEDFDSYDEYTARDVNKSNESTEASMTLVDDEDLRTSEQKALDLFEKYYAQSIENEYFRNMGEILALKDNFKRLITPNTTDTLKNVRDQLVELSEVFDSSLNPTIISPMYMLKTRHDGLSVKDLIGIAAVAQTGIASAQLSSIVIDKTKIGKIWKRMRRFVKYNDAQPLLPHNSINGQATISSVKDVEDNYISDNNSEILSGAVDVFNDAFLPQIGYNRRTAPIFHLMVRLGMANSKENPIISLFMNQPIIRKYLGLLDIRGANSNIDIRSFNDIENHADFKGSMAISHFPKTLPEITKMLKDNIRTVYGNGQTLTHDQRAQQKLIFREFLKYEVLASELFRFQQGSSWDTARMNDPYSAYFKEYQRSNVAQNGIFSDINSYMNNAHIGTQKEYVEMVNETLSDVLIIQNEDTQRALQPILSRVASRFSGLETKKKIARKMEERLLGYLIQTKTGINNSLSHMMVDVKTALTTQLKGIREKRKEWEEKKKREETTLVSDDVIYNNLILLQLIPSIKGNTKLSTKNITLAVKPRDVYSKNLYVKAFQELYDNPGTRQLARSLVKLSFLQNGVGNSRISFKDAIPAKLYSDVVNEIVGELQNTDALEQFIDTDDFYKNNWNDSDIVPPVYDDDFPLADNYIVANFMDRLKKQGVIPQSTTPPDILWLPVSKAESHSKFVTHVTINDQPDGSTLVERRLFQRVEISPREAYSEFDVGEDENFTLFVQATALGDADRAQESYATQHNSVFQNGYTNPDIQVDVKALYDYLKNGETDDEDDDRDDNEPPVPTAPTATTQGEIFEYKGVERVISGGQTGVDVAGLDAALEVGIPTGGTAAARFQQSTTGDKKIFTRELAKKYGLKEGKITKRQGKYGMYEDVYYQRTIDNAQEADGTIWFGNPGSPGGLLTLGAIAQKGKPKPLVNPKNKEEIQKWLKDNKIRVLNVAGNREHTNPGIYEKAKSMLVSALAKPVATIQEPRILEPGRYVTFNGETYIVTKKNANGTWQIYNPTKEGVDAKKSVAGKSLILSGEKATIVKYKDAEYLVTPKNTIISLVSNKIMNWSENHGNRKAIIAAAFNQFKERLDKKDCNTG